MNLNEPLSLKDAIANGFEFDEESFGITLRTDVWLTLRTRFAQMLIRGRVTKGKPQIIGLIRFADMLRVIWKAAGNNDPYADWWLIKVHDELITIAAEISKAQNQLNRAVRSNPAFRVVPPANKEVFRIKLSFATPYAYQAARLLSQYDDYVCETLAAKHLGALDTKESKQAIHAVATKIRRLFALGSRYRHLGIDRNCTFSFVDQQETAERYMGVLPEDVLTGNRRARFAPPINSATQPLPPITEAIPEFEDLST